MSDIIEITTNGIEKGNYNESNLINIGIKPTENAIQSPICIYCVVDVSGSMCGTVTKIEETYISRLDLVIHSLKTIVNSLDDNDEFCLISFSSTANLQLKETKIKDKEIIVKNIMELRPMGCTDILAGVNLAIDTLKKTNNKNVNNYIMVFTDGEQTIQYNEKIDELLRQKIEKEGNINGVISTFTFGYNVDSVLMENIARLGNGIYGFCPDFTMVGTVFINFMANIKATIYPCVEISFKGESKIEKKTINETINIGGLYMDNERNTIINIGDVNPLDVVGEIKVNIIGKDIMLSREWDCTNNNECKVINIDSYINEKNSEAEANGISKDVDESDDVDVDNKEEKKNDDDDDDEDDMADKDEDEDEDGKEANSEDLFIERCHNISIMDKLLNQIYRNKLLKLLNKNNDENINLDEVQNNINSLYNEIKYFYYRTELMKGILVDLKSQNPNKGQIEKAFNEEHYNKWGRSYLKSFNRYHILEQCGNFKDNSLKPYSSKKFVAKRNIASKIFLNTQLVTIDNRRSRNGYGSNNSINGGVSTTTFYNRNGGCFDGDALVKLNNNSVKKVRNLVFGDVLSNGCQVRCVVEQTLKENKDCIKTCLVDGVYFSPYHPIFYKKKWCFPCDIVPVETNTKIDAWFNLILQDENKKYEVEFKVEKKDEESTIKAITLGHGRNENKILEHPYFGTEKVIKSLENKYKNNFKQGYIKIENINIERDNQNGLIKEYY